MKTGQASVSISRRIAGAMFNWRTLCRVLLAGIALIVLVVVFYAEEDWRGKRDWAAYKLKLKQESVPFTQAEMLPPSVPDDQNFAMTPSLALHSDKAEYALRQKLSWDVIATKESGIVFHNELLGRMEEGRQVDLDALAKPMTGVELAEMMKKYDAVLNEFTSASRRPAARFSSEISLLAMVQLGEVFEVRALVELTNGQTDRATDDVLTLFRIARCLTQGANLTYQIVSISDVIKGSDVLQEGLVSHRWTPDQLVAMQNALEQIDFVAALRRGLRGEQVSRNEMEAQVARGLGATLNGYAKTLGSWLDHPRSSTALYMLWGDGPSGWVDESLIDYNQYFSGMASALNVADHRFDVLKLDQIESNYEHRYWAPDLVLARVSENDTVDALKSAAMDVERLDEAVVACALERYRLTIGTLPEKLEELTPNFLTNIPKNIVTGGSLHYERLADGNYVLYAVGWGGKEDGSQAPGDRDIVWHDIAQP